MNIRLVKLSNEYKKHLTEMMDEWTATNERIVPFAIRKNDYHDFEYYLEHLEIKEEVDKVRMCIDSIESWDSTNHMANRAKISESIEKIITKISKN